MTEFDAQAGRVAADVNLTSEQVAADEVDLAGGLQGLAAMVDVGQSLEETLTEIASTPNNPTQASHSRSAAPAPRSSPTASSSSSRMDTP